LTRNQKNFKELILNLLTVRLKLDPFSQRKKSTLFNLLEINQKFGPSLHQNLPTPYKRSTGNLEFLKSSIQKKNRANKLINHLLNKKTVLKPKKKVMPFLLHQYQQLRTKKKNKLSGLDRTKISSEMIKKYNFNKKIERSYKKLEIAKNRAQNLNLVHLEKKIPDVDSEDEDPQLEKNRTRTYRQSFRMSYKKHLNLLVRYQYKL
jgi:hypothetical protein